MNLVERDEAIATLDALLVAAVAGKGRVAVVTGAVATGKTALLNAFADRAVDRGALAITAAASPAERDLPLGVICQLLLDAPLVAEERQRAMNLLYEGGARPVPGGDGRQLDPQIVHALCTVLLELSQRCPLVIAVDDIDCADRASIVCLCYLARRVRFAPMMVLGTQADHRPADETSFEAETLWRPSYGSRIVVGTLSPDGVRSMAAGAVGSDAAERFGAAWHRISGGNPLLVAGLLDDYRQAMPVADVRADQPPVGERYARAVVSCLHRADARLLPVARGIAVSAQPALLEQLVPTDAARVTLAVRALTAAGLLDEGDFRHPVARAAVLAEIDDTERAELHLRAALLAYRDGAPSTVVAEHLLGAAEAGEAWMVPVLEDAARQALREGRVAIAVRFLKMACHSCTDDLRRTRIMATLLRAEWRINPSAPAGYLPKLTAALRDGYLPGSDALVLARALLWHGQFADAGEVLEYLGAHRDEADQDSAAELAITRPLLRTAYPPFVSLLRPPVRPSVAISTVTASHRLEAANALLGVLTRGPSAQLVGNLERILHNSRLDEMSLDTVESALLALTYGGRPDRAKPWCDLFIDEAASRGAPSRHARLAAIRAEISIRLGDMPAALGYARQALTVMPPSSWGVAVGGPLAALIVAASAIGDVDTVREHLDQPVPREMFQTRCGLPYLYARGRHSLTIGELPLALRDFELCGELTAKWKMDVPGLIPWRVDAAETLMRMNQPAAARDLAEQQLNRCGDDAPREKAMALRLYAASGPLRQRPMVLRQAADLHADGDQYELARTLIDLTEAFHALGESRRAGMIARRAYVAAQRSGAPPLLRSLHREAYDENDGAAPPLNPAGGSTVLSEAERRVAALAATGYSNREISEKLYITVSTVEQHLTRTYRKLNVTRRTDLPANLSPDLSTAG